MGYFPSTIPNAQDPGTTQTVPSANAICIIPANNVRHAWAVKAAVGNTDAVYISFGGQPTLKKGDNATAVAVTGDGTATTSSIALQPGESYTDPAGSGVIFAGAITAIANSGSQTVYTVAY